MLILYLIKYIVDHAPKGLSLDIEDITNLLDLLIQNTPPKKEETFKEEKAPESILENLHQKGLDNDLVQILVSEISYNKSLVELKLEQQRTEIEKQYDVIQQYQSNMLNSITIATLLLLFGSCIIFTIFRKYIIATITKKAKSVVDITTLAAKVKDAHKYINILSGYETEIAEKNHAIDEIKVKIEEEFNNHHKLKSEQSFDELKKQYNALTYAFSGEIDLLTALKHRTFFGFIFSIILLIIATISLAVYLFSNINSNANMSYYYLHITIALLIIGPITAFVRFASRKDHYYFILLQQYKHKVNILRTILAAIDKGTLGSNSAAIIKEVFYNIITINPIDGNVMKQGAVKEQETGAPYAEIINKLDSFIGNKGKEKQR